MPHSAHVAEDLLIASRMIAAGSAQTVTGGDAMKVYVVETGCYDSRFVSGVYASPEAAMAAHPIPADYKYPNPPSAANLSRPTGWTRDTYADDTVSWSNGLDWDNAASIEEYEVEGA